MHPARLARRCTPSRWATSRNRDRVAAKNRPSNRPPASFRNRACQFSALLTNRSKTLYIGVTGNLEKRVFAHKNGLTPGFASRYKIDRLVYFERFGDVAAAIAREKQIKGLVRLKKMALIVSMNPDWKDLSVGWFTKHQYQPQNA